MWTGGRGKHFASQGKARMYLPGMWVVWGQDYLSWPDWYLLLPFLEAAFLSSCLKPRDPWQPCMMDCLWSYLLFYSYPASTSLHHTAPITVIFLLLHRAACFCFRDLYMLIPVIKFPPLTPTWITTLLASPLRCHLIGEAIPGNLSYVSPTHIFLPLSHFFPFFSPLEWYLTKYFPYISIVCFLL